MRARYPSARRRLLPCRRRRLAVTDAGLLVLSIHSKDYPCFVHHHLPGAERQYLACSAEFTVVPLVYDLLITAYQS